MKAGKDLNPLKKVPDKTGDKKGSEDKKKLNIDLGKIKMDILS